MFQDIEDDNDGTSNSNVERFSDRPHVKRFVKKRKLTNNCKNGHDKDVFFKASYRIQGVFVNLGTHQSSASAAAAVDLAHTLYSEDGTPKEELQVLSQVEANLALRSAKARKLPSPNNPNEFVRRLNMI